MTNPTSPAPVLKPHGMSYVGDAGSVSYYRLQVDGIALFDILVDNAVTVDADAAGVKLQAEGTLHPIAVQTTDGKVTLETKGVGVKLAHSDPGAELLDHPPTPAHIDGITVQQYILPRALHFAAKLLQARQEV